MIAVVIFQAVRVAYDVSTGNWWHLLDCFTVFMLVTTVLIWVKIADEERAEAAYLIRWNPRPR
jgi:hypothetical protein